MPVYEYKARNSKGALVKGELEFGSEEEIKKHLASRKLVPVDVKEKTAWNTDLNQLPLFKPKVKTKDIAIFCRQFSVMIEAGVSIGGTLDILRKQIENTTLRQIIQEVHDEVQKGRSLSESMGEHDEFPEILINMIEAGEVSGNLDSAMNQMAIHFEKQMKLDTQVKKAMTYPYIVTVLMIVVVAVLIVFVVPRYTSMFSSINAELPAATLALVGISDFIIAKWYFIGGIIIALIAGFRYLKTIDSVIIFFDQLALKAPLVAQLNKKIITANFARTLSSLMKAGIPIIQTMEILKKIVGNTVAREVIEDCISEIKQGGNLAACMQESSLFPVMLVSMVRIGEESGSIDTIMDKTADFFEEEVELAVDRLTSLITPIITLIMGVMVAFIMLAIMTPMLSLASQL